MLKILAQEDLAQGGTVAVDGTTLEANAALRAIVRRDTGEKCEQYLKDLAKAAGIENPAREELARFDRKRKKKGPTRNGNIPMTPTRGLPR